jgi:membrane protein
VTGLERVWRDHVGPAIEPKLLPAVYQGIDATAERIFRAGGGGVVALGSVLAIWNVSSAVRACMTSLNRLYNADEKRPWWLRFPISFGLAAVIIASVLGSFLLLVAARGLGAGAAGVVISVGRWAAAILVLGISVELVMRFAPAVRRSKKWATTGTALVVVAWLATSAAFRWYVGSVADFKSAVGTLAVLFVLTAYIYSSAIVFLVGVQLDELLRTGTGEHTVIDLIRGRF